MQHVQPVLFLLIVGLGEVSPFDTQDIAYLQKRKIRCRLVGIVDHSRQISV